MRRALGWCLAAFVALASAGPRDAASAPRPFHLVGHWGKPTPDVRFVEKGGRAKWRHPPGFAIWSTAVAPGGKFALLRVSYEPWTAALLVLALPEGRIVRAVQEPEGRLDRQWFALSSDGRWGLFAGENNDAVVWDTERPRELGRLVGGHAAQITSTAISPDGRAALTGDARGGVALWSLPDRKLRHRYSVEYGANAVAFSADGKRGIGAGRNVVMIDVATGRQLLMMYGHGDFDRAAFTPDGKRVVLASAHEKVMTVSDVRTGRLLQLRKQEPIPWEIAMAPDGRSVLGLDQFCVRRWHLDDLGKVDQLGEFGGIVGTGVGVGAGGRMFFTTSEDGDLKLWDARTGKRVVSHHGRAVTALAWTPDGSTLVAGAQDGTVTFWNASGQRLRESARHEHAVRGLAISADGKLAASAAGDAVIWPLPRGEERLLKGDDAVDLAWVAFAAGDKRILAGADAGGWSAADVARPATLPEKKCDNLWSAGESIAIDHGKALLVAITSWGRYPHGGDSDDDATTLARLDLATCKIVWSDHGRARTAMAVSRDEKLALVASRTGGLSLYKLADGQEFRALETGADDDRDGGDDEEDGGRGTRTTAIGFLAEDQAMTGDSAGGLTVWNVATGRAIGRLRDVRRRKSVATAIAARPGTRTVAVGTNRGEILIFAP